MKAKNAPEPTEINGEHNRIEGLSATDLIESEKKTVVRLALAVLSESFINTDVLSDPAQAETYLRLRLAPNSREVFAVLFLNSKHQVLAYEELFYGSINTCNIHPRVVVQRGLSLNAAAVILAHNHPSNYTEPSAADIAITSQLIKSLQLIEIQVLDHLIVGANDCVSMSDRGLICL